MATTAELQQKLLAKLRELFQLDQPDLDFGFYRVMHAKAKEINDYLDNKLPAVISAAFKDSDGAAVAEKESAYHAAVAQAQSFGAPDPEATEPVKKAKAAWEEAKNGAGAEADVYDHLYHFFERYYDKGDFVSLRYLTRETDRKAKPYAIPYAGEEVMLHWANADQYYIKTSENFSHFTFDAAQHPDIVKMDAMARLAANVPEKLKVHFEIVDADEGDHGNIKASKERFFILHDEKKCEVKDGEVYVYFEYREDPEKTGKTDWQVKRRTEAVEALKTVLPTVGLGKELCDFLFLNLDDGVKGKEPRILLDVYLKRYFARNTSDYFIHKDLGGFLRRELDFYIKNDLMVLDNVAAPNTTAESVAKWLDTLKVFRRIADDIITFLAQLEDFQKKLWLKKKFIVQCDYCMTMDRVKKAAEESGDVSLYDEATSNSAQIAEWEKLGIAEDPTQSDMTAVDARMIDTKNFDDAFKQRLLAAIDDFDEQCDGVLIHSDNFQGMNFLLEKHTGTFDCVYLDPPYNAKTSEILYKNTFKHSAWISFMDNRIALGARLKHPDGANVIAIDENEIANLSSLLAMRYPSWSINSVSIVHNPAGVQGDNFSYSHEYALYGFLPQKAIIGKTERGEPTEEAFRDWGGTCSRSLAKNCFYPIYVKDGDIIGFGEVSPKEFHPGSSNILRADGVVEVYPVDEDGYERKWVFARQTVETIAGNLRAKNDGGVWVIKRIKTETSYKTVWTDKRYYANIYGSKLLNNILGAKRFDFPKSLYTVQDCIYAVNRVRSKNSQVLDYFGGSGTTAHAVIDLNRQDGGRRKYILIEMGDHFDTALMPRVQKVVYSPDWKDGKPTASAKGISHCFKYFRLESYEDALNNLQVDGEKGAAFAEVGDYFFKYMLDVETKGSPSLLNIEQFSNPFGYKLIVKKPGSEEREERTVDLVETFNYLIGLRVKHTAATVGYDAEFERAVDPELPTDAHTKLTIKGKIKLDEAGPWKFRTVEGWCPKNRATPNDGAKERVLIVWRTLTGDSEKDNIVLNAFFQRKDFNALNGEYDVIYVNGSNNVPNLRKDSDTWKVRLIEEEFRARMWEGV